MANQIRINNNVNSPVTFTSAPFILLNYKMGAAETSYAASTKIGMDIDIAGVSVGESRDILTVMLNNATAALTQSDYQELESFVARINMRQSEDSGPKVYLEVQLEADSSFWASEILMMRLQPADDMLIQMAQGKLTFDVEITRRGYWQKVTASTLTGTNGNGSSTAITIKNHDDGGAGDDNWASYPGSNIAGTLPGPVRLTIKNASGSSFAFKNVYLGVNGVADPANFQHVWEAENATGGIGSNTSDANSSNGSYRTITVASASDVTALYWIPSTSFFAAARGIVFRALLACKAAIPVNAFVSLGTGVFDSPLFVRTWRGDEVQGDGASRIYDLGNVRLPPTNFVSGTTYSSGFSLNLRTTGASAINPDFIMFVPASNYCKITQGASSLLTGNNEFLVYDAANNEATYKNSSGNKLPIYTTSGADLMLWPINTNRIYVLFDEPSYTATRSLTLQVEHFARRLTI